MANTSRIVRFTGLAGLLFIVFATVNVSAQSLSYTGNLQFSTGDYFFTERTESVYFTNGLSFSGSRTRISFNLPYVIQSSPLISYGSSGGIPTGGTGHRQVGQKSGGRGNQSPNNSENGHGRVEIQDTVSYRTASFADPSVYGSFKILSSTSTSTSLTLNTSVKIPLAKPSSGFGTGEWDFGAGLSLFQRFHSIFIFGDVMFWRMGDMADLALNNPVSLSAGVGKAFINGKWMVSTSAAGSTKIIDSADPPASLNIGLGYYKSTKASINGTLSVGLSESSADVSAGIGWSYQL